VEQEHYAELDERCGFSGLANVWRTEQEVRDAIVQRAQSEWAAWGTSSGGRRRENVNLMFGRLIGYYLATVQTILPDSLQALQGAALTPINYAPLLVEGASAATLSTETNRIRRELVAAAPGTSLADIPANVISRARQAHFDTGSHAAWSAAFVSASVRGAGMALALEAVQSPRQHFGANALLKPSTRHSDYAFEAHQRRQARPPRRGCYHAFAPRERAPRLGDIIVQDRQAERADQLITFARIASIAGGYKTHGDIIVEVQPDWVVAIGGNLGNSVRKRRYPRDAQGLLVTELRRNYSQETDAGTLPNVPAATAGTALDGSSTLRIFTLLSVVEECAVRPGQAYGGGILT
jgi:hypothetical protein